VGDESLLYHGRWRNVSYGPDYWSEVALATLPRDRWGALGLYPAGERDSEPEGWVWTAPVRLPAGGCQLSLNGDHVRQMRVEVTDERFRPLEGYAGGAPGDRIARTASTARFAGVPPDCRRSAAGPSGSGYS
jgi:hypothetical protein